jgi:hypothetical protein
MTKGGSLRRNAFLVLIHVARVWRRKETRVAAPSQHHTFALGQSYLSVLMHDSSQGGEA